MRTRFVYPEGKSKALTMSYDDGVVADRRLVEIFNRYGIKGTFHLNSATFGTKGKIDPEEIFLTEEILGEKDEEYQPPKPSGCLLTLITLPFLIILKGLLL